MIANIHCHAPQVCPWGYFHRNLTDKGRLTLNTEIGRSVMYPIVYFIHLLQHMFQIIVTVITLCSVWDLAACWSYNLTEKKVRTMFFIFPHLSLQSYPYLPPHISYQESYTEFPHVQLIILFICTEGCILSDTFSDFGLDHSSLCYISSFFLPLPTYDVFQNMCTQGEGLWSLSDFWF